MKLSQIAELVGGRLVGNPDLVCEGVEAFEQALPGQITMIDDPARIEQLDSQAVAIVTPTEVEIDPAQIVVDDPHQAFAAIVQHFRPPVSPGPLGSGVDSTANVAVSAYIHSSAIIGANVTIGHRTRVLPGAVIMEGSTIGDDCVINPSVTIYEHTQIADRVIIHAGCTIGANGFGYRQENGRHIPSAQLGYVAIESDVELGASVTIDRGTYGATRIGEGTKIDNQVMIAHNCQIGKHNLICSQVGIAGSCRTGDYVILAGQVGLKDHVSLGDRAIVGAQAGVMDNLEGDCVYLGSPATTQRDQMQIMAVERRLPEMRRELKQLQRQIAELQDQLSANTRQAA